MAASLVGARFGFRGGATCFFSRGFGGGCRGLRPFASPPDGSVGIVWVPVCAEPKVKGFWLFVSVAIRRAEASLDPCAVSELNAASEKGLLFEVVAASEKGLVSKLVAVAEKGFLSSSFGSSSGWSDASFDPASGWSGTPLDDSLLQVCGRARLCMSVHKHSCRARAFSACLTFRLSRRLIACAPHEREQLHRGHPAKGSHRRRS